MTSVPADLGDHFLRAGHRLGPFNGRVVWYEAVQSTNDVAAQLAEQGGAEGIVIGADAQRAGRGRFGRSWESPAGAGLYVSVVLRPPLNAASLLTVMAGVSLAEGIERSTGLAAGLKWPNDLIVGGRKLAGILAEGRLSEAADGFVVVGFGINVSAAAYPPDVAARATSLETELGRPVERGLVLVECLAALAARYGELRSGHVAGVIDAWRGRAAASLGRTVEWEGGSAVNRGIATDIDETGALLVRTPAGTAKIRSGEVRWLQG